MPLSAARAARTYPTAGFVLFGRDASCRRVPLIGIDTEAIAEMATQYKVPHLATLPARFATSAADHRGGPPRLQQGAGTPVQSLRLLSRTISRRTAARSAFCRSRRRRAAMSSSIVLCARGWARSPAISTVAFRPRLDADPVSEQEFRSADALRLFRLSRIALITPLRDGMNLVAKGVRGSTGAQRSRRTCPLALCGGGV